MTNQRAALFDAAILVANLAVVAPLTRLAEQDQPLFGVLLLAAAVAQCAGGWLKRAPLQARLMKTPAWGGGVFALFLVLGTMHLGVFLMAGVVPLELLGIQQSTSATIGGIALGLLPTVFVIRALVPPNRPVDLAAKRLAAMEAAADAAVGLSTVVMFALWEGVFVGEVAGKSAGHPAVAALLLVLMTVPFAMFYLAPRMMFVAEDFRDRRAWLRVLLVALPSAWRIVF